MKITINQMRKTNPCKSGWKRTIKALKDVDPDKPLDLIELIDVVGADDAVFALSFFDFSQTIHFRIILKDQIVKYGKSANVKNTFTEFNNDQTDLLRFIRFVFGDIYYYCKNNLESHDHISLAEKMTIEEVETAYRLAFERG